MKNDCVKHIEREMMLLGSLQWMGVIRLFFYVSPSIDFMAFLYYVNMYEYICQATPQYLFSIGI